MNDEKMKLLALIEKLNANQITFLLHFATRIFYFTDDNK